MITERERESVIDDSSKSVRYGAWNLSLSSSIPVIFEIRGSNFLDFN